MTTTKTAINMYGFQIYDRALRSSVNNGWTTEGLGVQDASNYLATRAEAEAQLARLAEVTGCRVAELRIVAVEVLVERAAPKITISMSETSPVRIDPAAWPIVAEADRHDGQVRCQATNEWWLAVREHADGRRIVYGCHVAGDGGQYAGFRPRHAGWLLDAGADVARAIRRVAGVIGDEQLAAECIAALPAQDI